ncbi:DUF2163 domain-containing protein [Sneathiella aquimaris]|uniref:DUF2163 domain-containing protein n=1 Tax=Sneathiella aquimaris TaxID=2599305 RepID=UPI00146DD009|nr:DUF2163 domain-containing protein [Sneathiella aquimaris]
MKNLSNEVLLHIKQEVTSISSFLVIDRKDGVSFRFTDHDQDVHIAGERYISAEGFDRSALKGSSASDTDDLEITGILSSEYLQEEELKAGLFDYAEIRYFLANWQAPEQGLIPLRKGWLGEVRWSEGLFTAEIRGLTDALKRQIGKIYAPECQADFCDAACQLDPFLFRHTDTVAEIKNTNEVILTGYQGDVEALSGGILSFVTGLNAGGHFEIDAWDPVTKTLTLFLPLPFKAESGDTVFLVEGCDKRFATCRDRFENQLNFRGFPSVPGTDSLAGPTNGS